MATTSLLRKKKGILSKRLEPTDHRPNLSNVHISDIDDSHSNTAPPRGMQAAKLEPHPNSEKLLQMLSLCESKSGWANRDDLIQRGRWSWRRCSDSCLNTTTQTNQDTTESPSSPTAKENVRTTLLPQRTRESLHKKLEAQPIDNLRWWKGYWRLLLASKMIELEPAHRNTEF